MMNNNQQREDKSKATTANVAAGELPLSSSSSTTAKATSKSSARSTTPNLLRSRHEALWNQRYSELVEFQKGYGHCLVPLTWPKNPSLSHWIKRQRHQHRLKKEQKHHTLTEERLEKLMSIGFVWDSQAAQWEERWNELKRFREDCGHCNVPKNYPENPR